jgi:hypothetical protein
MSHIDELDEFEAQLELTLKKEYSAVFGLFRYCVLTQDATYLCNKLDLQYVPQPSYPFFHLRMEDVWVWDKNRPTRIIPRAEVYTSSDVTVEELRGEGDEPTLTAEDLAERIGEPLSSDDEERLRDLRFAVALVEALLEAPPELLAGPQHRESGPPRWQPQNADVVPAIAVAAGVGLRLLERTRPSASASQTHREHLLRRL